MKKNEWKGKTAVVTAVAGDYDLPRNHIYEDGVDYVYFTDGLAEPPDGIWKKAALPKGTRLDNRRLAKLPKIYPNQFEVLSSYDYMVWIDGDMSICSTTFVNEVLSYMNSGLVLSPHPSGRCLYGEASIDTKEKHKGEPVKEQSDHYKEIEVPKNLGLYAAGLHARDLRNTKVTNVARDWLIETMIWSNRDQISLPYVLWKSGFEPDVLPKSLYDYDWVRISIHKYELEKQQQEASRKE